MSDQPGSPTVRWGQRQRYLFLELRLFWEGYLSRGDLMQRFGISAAQASSDIANYEDLAPGNVELDRSLKVFAATESFAPRFVIPSARQYLTQLLLVADEAIGQSESWLGVLPPNAVMPRLRRRLDVETLRPLVRAIHQRRDLEVYYQSMTAAEPTARWIAPHALVFDGARWHARSWCFNRSRFSDFVLARVLKIGGERRSNIEPAMDGEWNEHFTMMLAPHPGLSDTQRQAIEMDYDMTEGIYEATMRLCLTPYFERHYGLDLPADLLPPSRRQIILKNREQLEQKRAIHGRAKGAV